MAKKETTIEEDFETLLSRIEKGILNSSRSVSVKDRSRFCDGVARCSVIVLEKRSYAGVSMNITLFQNGDSPVQLTAITSAGSNAVMNSINTKEEKTFLNVLKDVLGIDVHHWYDEETE